MQVLIDVPEDLIHAIKLPAEEIPSRLKKELAVRLYRKGFLGFGKARILADMAYWDFYDLLNKEAVLRRYDIQELDEDIKTLEELF